MIGVVKIRESGEEESSILPTSTADTGGKKFDDTPFTSDDTTSSNSSTASNPSSGTGNLQARSKPKTSYTYPLVQHAGYSPPSNQQPDQDPDHHTKKPKIYGGVTTKPSKPKKKRKGVRLGWYEFRTSLGKVLLFGGVVYAGLVWGDRR
jgi:hypothetical protein